MLTRHQLYLATIVAKATLGVVQLTIAVALYFGVLIRLPHFVNWLVAGELAENPNDFMATHILALINVVPTTASAFYVSYFAAHGTLHVMVVAALLWGAKWANHAAVFVLCAFVVYQVVEWLNIGGKTLIVLTFIDLFVIYLTVMESLSNRRQSM